MTSGIGFTHAAICSRSLLYAVAVVDELDAANVRHAVLWKRTEAWQSWTVKNRIIAICKLDPVTGQVLFVGNDGNMLRYEGDSFQPEAIGVPEKGPSALRTLTAAQVIGKYVYAAGMQRQVFRRPLAGGNWSRCDQTCLEDGKPFRMAGFLAIQGFHEEDLYATGYHGEIWHFDGKRWTSLDSPTNVRITSICCVEPGVVYLSGDHGLLLKGNNTDGWEVIGDGSYPHTFWSMEYFAGVLYLSSNHGKLFQLEDQAIVPVDFKLKHEVSTFTLTQGDGLLLSIGNHDLLLLDGETWSPIPLPKPP
ncbi:MAG TPA: hypothetical protein PKD72_16250, partial [Gemmatales bacterium]|nr:hypothetical protein [Gemmatales bacterium]